MQFGTKLIAALMVMGGSLSADIQYTEKTTMVGGSMAGMMRMAEKFSKKARPMDSTVSVKGNRMSQANEFSSTIYDLDAGTVTQIDHEKKQFSRVTFEQMNEAQRKAMAKSSGKKEKEAASNVEMDVEVSSKSTGKSMTLAGVSSKQTILMMNAKMQEKNSANSGAFYTSVDGWYGTPAGYRDYTAFQQKLAMKMASSLDPSIAAAPMGMGSMRVKADIESKKINGLPLLTVTRIGGTAASVDPTSAPAPSAVAEAPKEEKKKGGMFGGLAEKMAAAAAGVPSSGSGGSSKGDSNEPMMVMETRVSSVSSGPVTASVFEVPAGYKEVESELVKMLKK